MRLELRLELSDRAFPQGGRHEERARVLIRDPSPAPFHVERGQLPRLSSAAEMIGQGHSVIDYFCGGRLVVRAVSPREPPRGVRRTRATA